MHPLPAQTPLPGSRRHERTTAQRVEKPFPRHRLHVRNDIDMLHRRVMNPARRLRVMMMMFPNCSVMRPRRRLLVHVCHIPPERVRLDRMGPLLHLRLNGDQLGPKIWLLRFNVNILQMEVFPIVLMLDGRTRTTRHFWRLRNWRTSEPLHRVRPELEMRKPWRSWCFQVVVGRRF